MPHPTNAGLEPARIGRLILVARRQLGWNQMAAADALGVSTRALSRWEHGAAVPWKELRRGLALALRGAEGETWRALVEALGLPLDAMLAEVPSQQEKLPPPPAPPPPPEPPPPPVDARAAIDASVRAFAEDLDVSPRRVRLMLALFLGDIVELGLTPKEARAVVAQRGDEARART